MKQNPISMVARWFIAMQELHFTVVFVHFTVERFGGIDGAALVEAVVVGGGGYKAGFG